MEEQNTSEDQSLDSIEALSGILSVVNALCRGKTENNDNENNDDGSSCNDGGDDNDDDDDDALGEIGEGKNCFLESEGQRVTHFTSDEIKDNNMSSRCDSLVDSDKQTQPLKRPAETQNPSQIHAKRNYTIDVPTYLLDETRIITFPDVYAAVRKACGNCSSLRGKINKLGIVAKRFHPWEMTRLKHVGAIGLDVKCCSYINSEEFIQIIQNYKDVESLSPEMFNFLSAVNLTCVATNKSLDEKVVKVESVLDSKSSRLTSSPLHTFIVDDEVVVCTVELQQVFEALFGKVFCVSLTKLGVFQKKFNPCQLDEVMDFVDIDESSVSSASFYVSKKDGERVFRYAEALFNVEQVTVRWMEPLKLTDSASLTDNESSDSNFQRFNTGSVAPLERAASSIPVFARNTSNVHCVPEISDRTKTETETDEGTVYCLPNILYSSSDDSPDASPQSNSLPREVMSDLCEVGEPSKKISPKNNTEDITALAKFQAEDSPSSSFSDENVRTDTTRDVNEKTKFLNMAGQNQVLEPCVNPSSTKILNQSASSSGLYHSNEEYPSSPDSETSSISELDSCSSIRTYQIDGNEVVCIPDIHKIVIHLYGQSVQVGYYLQRLQIPTQRFSTDHVKRLKALNALNSKATLCTYILKSDAQRLLKMYDVFCTESKIQQIQWSNPVSLEAFEGAIPYREEAPILPTESLKSKSADPIGVLKIPTFKIDGEVVVSVPDAHKVVQVLNGQSVQVRYNMDKLGIVKRKYSYSQVYQLRAISDLKRPSMCTFITKADADKLLAHYLTAENVSRLNYIHWLPPVQLEELNGTRSDGVSTVQDVGNTGRRLPVMINSTETVVSDGQSAESNLEQKSFNYKRTSDVSKDMETFLKEQRASQFSALPLTSKNNESTFTPSSVAQNNKTAVHLSSEYHHQNYTKQGLEVVTLDSRMDENPSSTSPAMPDTCIQGTTRDHSSSGPLETATDSPRYGPLLSGADVRDSRNTYDQPAGSAYSTCNKTCAISTVTVTKPCSQNTSDITDDYRRLVSTHSNPGEKRLQEECKDKDSSGLEIKRLKAEKDDIAATLERKETEMKILHDAYQQQVACERENRIKVEKEAAELRASNEELKKNLQRKESEMKILHDSYQYQIRKERQRREELENELTDLRGSVAFASGVAVSDSHIKQEKF
ncbi:uncharacterized protein LOC116290569 [Actinia tenebrosa]|uniref:Uncharacterized protein LOC116290569 n=1 Tax=Actinia tenebrosa TaxID=6105 RepID=A0A6P8HLK1_ACTTE|nr:uncharacterized protein LOC116290569 [Actinia tenebrosa]